MPASVTSTGTLRNLIKENSMLIQWTESWAGLEKPGMDEEAPKNQCQQAAAGDTGRDP